jgi:hypothetical protein
MGQKRESDENPEDQEAGGTVLAQGGEDHSMEMTAPGVPDKQIQISYFRIGNLIDATWRNG